MAMCLTDYTEITKMILVTEILSPGANVKVKPLRPVITLHYPLSNPFTQSI